VQAVPRVRALVTAALRWIVAARDRRFNPRIRARDLSGPAISMRDTSGPAVHASDRSEGTP
jgi:hypothetical protein